MSRKNPRSFFKKQELHSRVKSEIVTKYFTFWVDFMKKKEGSLTYLDLFSGRGYFDDGNISTPLMIFNEVANRPELYSKLSMYFYEKDKLLFQDLKEKLLEHPVFHKLNNEPLLNNTPINSESIKTLPITSKTLTFIDPCGYSGLSEELLLNVIENWGNDCIFYLSSAGIRRNINNESEREKLIKIFGEEEYLRLRGELQNCVNVKEVDNNILQSLNISLNKKRNLYSCGLRIDFPGKKMSNYYLMYISKHWFGFKVMKHIMSNEHYTSIDSDGIPEYIYNSKFINVSKESFLPTLNPRMNNIKNEIFSTFVGQENLKFNEISESLHKNKFQYNDSNIKKALIELETEDKIIVDKPQKERIKDNNITLGPRRYITFKHA